MERIAERQQRKYFKMFTFEKATSNLSFGKSDKPTVLQILRDKDCDCCFQNKEKLKYLKNTPLLPTLNKFYRLKAFKNKKI